ncbi:MAG: hypothetical protein ACLRSW_14785 [Christensenellaceae bacterium]
MKKWIRMNFRTAKAIEKYLNNAENYNIFGCWKNITEEKSVRAAVDYIMFSFFQGGFKWR